MAVRVARHTLLRTESMSKPKKEYTGSAYIAVVGGENENGICRDSIDAIARRPGDTFPVYARGTKGFENRQAHINRFLKTQLDFILFLDHDMVFAADTLERLRAHKLPYVSGYYMRREYAPMMPIWFEPFRGFPMTPFTGLAERGKLHKIGASGWGCVLVHREVVLAVRELLKGEDEIIEDDMDVYPYDLKEIMWAIGGLKMLIKERPAMSTLMPALEKHVGTLEREIRPLRALKNNIGSDIRFPFYALKAGFQLWGDPDVSPSHITAYPLTQNDYNATTPDFRETARKGVAKGRNKERRQILAALKELAI